MTLEATGSSRGIFGADYSVQVVWIDDATLHAALLDYGDSDDMGHGMDIVAPTGHVTGVLHMDGTSTALLETYLQPSGFQTDFSLDLDTGTLTAL